jgi:hypothetical protein
VLIPVILTDDHRATVSRIAARCKLLRSSQVITAFYADATVQQMLAGKEVEARDRAAYMSGLVVAEVAIARRAA